jgi:ATP-dependent RNA helicase RhlE
MMFSATMPKLMSELADAYLDNPMRVQVNPPGQAAKKIRQSVHFVAQAAKNDLLVELLDEHRDDLALVFGRTKHGCEKLYKFLEKKGFAAASIHGNKSQGQRDRAIASFKAGKVRVLVATDVAARGIDIPGVRHVYNYDLPNVAENYVHRIGRTARAGADGEAIAFCAPDEIVDLKDIEKAMKEPIPVASGTEWDIKPGQKKRPNGGGGGGGRGRGGPRGGAGGGRPAGGNPGGGKPGGNRRRKPGGGGRSRNAS